MGEVVNESVNCIIHKMFMELLLANYGHLS